MDESSFTGEPVQKMKQVATVTGHGQEKLHISDMSNVAFQGTLVTGKHNRINILKISVIVFKVPEQKGLVIRIQTFPS